MGDFPLRPPYVSPEEVEAVSEILERLAAEPNIRGVDRRDFYNVVDILKRFSDAYSSTSNGHH